MSKAGTALLALLTAVTVSTAKPRTWTSTSGATVDAEYVELKGTSLILQPAEGQPVSIPLDRLIPADRELARKLAIEAGHVPDEGSGAVTSPAANELTSFLDGTWKGQHTVYESDYYRAVIDLKGSFSIQPRADGADVGKPITHRFRASYNDLSQSDKKKRHRVRRVTEYNNPPPPAIIKTGKHEVLLAGTLDGDVALTRTFTFEPRGIRIGGKMVEPSTIEYPSSVSFGFRIDESVANDDYETFDELKDLTKGWEVTLSGPELSKTTIPFWESVKKKVPGVDRATVTGPWGKRRIVFEMPPSKGRNENRIYTTFSIYRGMPPLNGFGLGRHLGRDLGRYEADYTIEFK
jgi:hypothetical protein